MRKNKNEEKGEKMKENELLDRFGEVIDEFIEREKCIMLIEFPEGKIDPCIEDNVNLGPVVQFYMLLKAFSTIAQSFVTSVPGGFENSEKFEAFLEDVWKLLKADILDSFVEARNEEEATEDEDR